MEHDEPGALEPSGEPAPGRANVAKVAPTNAANPASFCDTYFAGDTGPTPQVPAPTKQTDWYQAIGLDAAAPIPIHVFVTPSGHVRCARAADVRETDYAAIEKLLGP